MFQVIIGGAAGDGSARAGVPTSGRQAPTRTTVGSDRDVVERVLAALGRKRRRGVILAGSTAEERERVIREVDQRLRAAGMRSLAAFEPGQDEVPREHIGWIGDMADFIDVNGAIDPDLLSVFNIKNATLVGEVAPRDQCAVAHAVDGFMQVVEVPMPDAQAARSALDHSARMLEQEHAINFTASARDAALAMTGGCTTSAADVLDVAAAVTDVDEIDAEHVRAAAKHDGGAQDPESARAFLAARVFGQPEAVEAAVRAWMRDAAGMCGAGERPSLLLRGRPGSGRRTLARALAELMGESLVTVDLMRGSDALEISSILGGPADCDPEDKGAISRIFDGDKSRVVFLDGLEGCDIQVRDAIARVLKGRRGLGTGRALVVMADAPAPCDGDELPRIVDEVANVNLPDDNMLAAVAEANLAARSQSAGLGGRALRIDPATPKAVVESARARLGEPLSPADVQAEVRRVIEPKIAHAILTGEVGDLRVCAAPAGPWFSVAFETTLAG